jgi:hypothetical protein
LKRHIFASPFDYVFEAVEKGQTPPLLELAWRGTNERIFIKAENKERCTVIFSIAFKDPDDIIIGKVFLQVSSSTSETEYQQQRYFCDQIWAIWFETQEYWHIVHT